MPKSMPRYSSKKLIELIEKDGWVLVNTKGSHYQFRHPVKMGRTTIPHPKKDLPVGTIKHIMKQAGVKK
jgi:predicted RNA binding protein YcfA (HicA-like mRNA interferase family)